MMIMALVDWQNRCERDYIMLTPIPRSQGSLLLWAESILIRLWASALVCDWVSINFHFELLVASTLLKFDQLEKNWWRANFKFNKSQSEDHSELEQRPIHGAWLSIFMLQHFFNTKKGTFNKESWPQTNNKEYKGRHKMSVCKGLGPFIHANIRIVLIVANDAR